MNRVRRGPDPASAVAFLASLAGPGTRLLELAIAGGRVALPRPQGVTVADVEASRAMVQRLRAVLLALPSDYLSDAL